MGLVWYTPEVCLRALMWVPSLWALILSCVCSGACIYWTRHGGVYSVQPCFGLGGGIPQGHLTPDLTHDVRTVHLVLAIFCFSLNRCHSLGAACLCKPVCGWPGKKIFGIRSKRDSHSRNVQKMFHDNNIQDRRCQKLSCPIQTIFFSFA